MRHRNAILSLAGAALLVPALALAQVTTALLQGRVIDQSGAVVSGATVEAHNLDTGLRRATTAGPDGSYRVAALPIGRYEIAATAGGFGREIRSGVTLQVGQQATIDFTLRPAAAAETMTVSAEAPIIEKTESAIATTITTRQIDQLPLSNRDFTELASMTPGIQRSFTEDGSISANGGTGSSNTFLIDGVSGDAEALGGQRTALSPDVVAEFQVLSSQYSAEFGRASGAVINVVTRAGANDVRGRVSGFYRNDSLTADNPFVASNEKTPFTQKIFGGFLGGPFKRDRAFYFASYERTDTDNTVLVTVDPAVLAGLGLDTHRAFASPQRQNRAFGKFDVNLTSTNLLSLRADLEDFEQKNFGVGGNATAETGGTEKLKQQNASLANTWIISQTMINDIRFQYGTNKTDLTDVNCPGCPYIIRPSLQSGKNPGFPQVFEEKRTQIVEALAFDVLQRGGDHSFKVGADVSNIKLPLFIPQYFDGVFIFTTDAPFKADDTTTYPQLYIHGTGDPSFEIKDNIYGVYAQDQWRMTPNFTLNLGVRWDYEDHIMVRNDRNNFAPRVHFTWDPVGDGKTAVRGGGGIYYDPIFLNAPLIGQFLSPARFQQEYVLFPGYPDPRVGGLQIPFPLPPTIAVTDTHASTPHIDTASIGVAREIARDLALSADYVHTRGRNLLLLLDANAPINGARPDARYAQELLVTTRGRSDYDSLQLGLRKRFGARYSLNVAYTLAKNENTTDSHRDFVNDSTNPEANFGSSLNDIRHTLNAGLNYSAPWGINIGLGGSYRSGAPYNITTGSDDNGDQNFNDRPPGVKRNSARGPATSTVNLRLAKLINWSGIDLELIGEAFNLFNKKNETAFIGNMKSPQFGKASDVLGAAFGPRQIQFGARLDF